MSVTLEQVLASRDARSRREKELQLLFPDSTLVVLTVIVPGSEKRTPASLAVAHAAMEELRRSFAGEILHCEERDLPTGYEAFMTVAPAAGESKRRCVAIEESHPLGRLMDIDVIGSDGTPLQRGILDKSRRRCLICGNEARYCMRARLHSPQELNAKIEELVNGYLQRH